MKITQLLKSNYKLSAKINRVTKQKLISLSCPIDKLIRFYF